MNPGETAPLHLFEEGEAWFLTTAHRRICWAVKRGNEWSAGAGEACWELVMNVKGGGAVPSGVTQLTALVVTS